MARKPTRAQAINGQLRKIPTWPVYLIGLAWVGWQFWLALQGAGKYAVEPINVLEREYGLRSLQLLILGLTITPIFAWTRVSLLRFRRAIGLTAFFFVVCHFSVWVLLDLGAAFDKVWVEIVKRPYITVGMLALTLLIPLALTSNNLSVRRLGRNWNRLHKLVYGIVLLGSLHFIWLVKGFPFEPLLYLGAILFLLALRLPLRRWFASGRQAVSA